MPFKYSKEFEGDLKSIYRAETEKRTEESLKKLREKWEEKYPLAVRPWVNLGKT